MQTNIKLFDFKSNEVRVINEAGEPLFAATDVAKALGFSNPYDATIYHVDEEDRFTSKISTPGGEQSLITINESGMYSLIFGSKLASAKEFKRWVTSEVLPQIRKTGSFHLNLSNVENRLGLECDQSKGEAITAIGGLVKCGAISKEYAIVASVQVAASKLGLGLPISMHMERIDGFLLGCIEQKQPTSVDEIYKSLAKYKQHPFISDDKTTAMMEIKAGLARLEMYELIHKTKNGKFEI